MRGRNTQQLERSIIPLSAVPAQGSMVEGLKAPGGKSGALDIKTLSNSPEEHKHSNRRGQDLRVPVLNMRGEPLMPTTPRKARKLLKEGKAKVEYQQGELQGYEVREYLLEKWGRKCAYCGKRDVPLEIEHIVPESRGGSDRVSNLTIACHDCNQEKGKKTAAEFGHPGIQKKAKETLKAAAFMNNIRWKLVNQLSCNWTFGSITKHNRTKVGIEKGHINDAYVIAGRDGTQDRAGMLYKGKQVRIQNRSRYKANLLKARRKKRNTVKEVKGYRRFDKVLYEGKKCFIFGLRSRGYFDLRDFEVEKIGSSVDHKKLKLVERARGNIWEVKSAIPLLTEVRSPLA